MSYRDMTFCGFWEDCADGDKCGRALTPEVEEGAKRWWGGKEGAPICMFMEQPDCHKEVEK